MKRYLKVILCVMFVLGTASVTALAAEQISPLKTEAKNNEGTKAFEDALYDTERNPGDQVVWTLENPGTILDVKDWKKMSDEELTDVINHSTDFQVAVWLSGLSGNEFYEVIQRETTLKYPVYQFTDTDEFEIIDGEKVQKQKQEVLTEHYYEYALNSLVSPLAWSDTTGEYGGTASGYFYFKIKDGDNVLTNLTVKVTDIKAGGNLSGKYTITGTHGTWETTSVTSEKENRQWAGVVLKGKYTKPAHDYTLWSSSGHGLGRYDPWNADYTNYTLDYTHSASDETDTVRIQVNGCNIGLVAGYTGYHATGTIDLVKYKNELKINPNGGVHGEETSTYTLATKKCEKTTTVSNPSRTGYDFDGWTVTNGTGAAGKLNGTTFTHCNKGATFSTDTDVYSKTTVTTTLKAKWKAKNYAYEVRHYKQKSDGTYPVSPDQTVTGTAAYASSFTGVVNTYTGYTSPAATTITISTTNNVISYYYTKNNFNLNIDPNGGTWQGSANVTVLQIDKGIGKTIEDPMAPLGGNVKLNYHDDSETVDTKAVYKVFGSWTKTGGGTFNAATKVFTCGVGDATLKANYQNGTLTLPSPTREHYTFVGWDTNANMNPSTETCDYAAGATISVSSDMELHGIWKAKDYAYEIRHFKQKSDGTYPASPAQTVKGTAAYGSQFTGDVKTYTGYISPEPQTITIGSSGNIITYYYQKSSFILTVNPNGGTWRSSDQLRKFQLDKGKNMTVENPTAPISGNVTLNYHDDNDKVNTIAVRKVFSSWSKTGGGSFNAASKVFTCGVGDATLTANYTNGKLILPSLTRQHYIFVGWDKDENTDPDTGTIDYAPGTSVAVSADMELHGIWRAKDYDYEVRHYKQMGNGKYPENPDWTVTGTARYGTKVTGNVIQYSGYTIPESQTITISGSDNVISYYYEKNSFILTVEPNGGNWRGTTSAMGFNLVKGKSMMIENPIPPYFATITLHHHDDAGTIKNEQIRKSFSSWTKTGGGTFDVGTGKYTCDVGDAVLSAAYGAGKFTLPTLTREYYTFMGWDTDADTDPVTGTVDYMPGQVITVRSDMALHAIWKLDFKLEADIERILAPHNPVFENGEMGLLNISLVGMVNKVEVTFPYEMSRYDGSLSQTHILTPKMTDELTQEFYVPLESADGRYRVTVKAYNVEGDSLIVYPNLTISGTILDDFRTRLK